MEGTRTILEAALEYHWRGWSIIPMAMQKKRPNVRWKRYQANRATEKTIRQWFAKGEHGIAVVFGGVSENLISRDFDTMESYERWAAIHPDLAKTLPTVATSRGRHVYATAAAEDIANLRSRIGKPDGTGAIKVADGELRCGVGCYSVVPPSVHPSGAVYRWVVPLPDGQLTEIDAMAAGFYQPPNEREEPSIDREGAGVQRLRRTTEAIKGETGGSQKLQEQKPAPPAAGDLWTDDIHEAIIGSLPDGPGRRHEFVFELARALKGLPELADAPLQDLRPYVESWHAQAFDAISTKPFEDTWIDFLRGWPRVEFPKGADPMTAIAERAQNPPLPPEAERYELPGLRSLVALCRELQRSAGDGPFYLGCRTAARILGTNRTTANNWLFLLKFDRIIEIVETGTMVGRRATRYHYLGEL